MSLAPVVELANRRRSVEALVAEHKAWALDIARMTLQRQGVHLDETTEAVAMGALRRAARTWDGKGDFHAFAYWRLKGWLRGATTRGTITDGGAA